MTEGNKIAKYEGTQCNILSIMRILLHTHASVFMFRKRIVMTRKYEYDIFKDVDQRVNISNIQQNIKHISKHE